MEEFRPAFRLHCYGTQFRLHPPPQTLLLEESTGEKGIERNISEFNSSQKLLSHPSVIFEGAFQRKRPTRGYLKRVGEYTGRTFPKATFPQDIPPSQDMLKKINPHTGLLGDYCYVNFRVVTSP